MALKKSIQKGSSKSNGGSVNSKSKSKISKKKINKKATSTLISKLNNDTNPYEVASIISKTGNKKEKAFDNIGKHHKEDLVEKEKNLKAENDILKQLEMIDDISL